MLPLYCYFSEAWLDNIQKRQGKREREEERGRERERETAGGERCICTERERAVREEKRREEKRREERSE